MSRELTEDEVRKQFLKLVWDYVEYWDKLPDKTCRERLEGLAFGMLVILDGGSAELPGFVVAPAPHPDDKEYHKERGENWFPENHESDTNCDIGGCLHELFFKAKKVFA